MTDTPQAGEPGALSTPEGDGPVRVGDRTAEGSPGSNQGQHETAPPDAGSAAAEPTGVPTSQLGVGAGDPQAPSHADASTRPFTEAASGPAPAAEGVARRATGQQGVAEEPIETDRAASAEAMAPPAFFSDAPGDAQSVPVVSEDSAEGTSETAPIVQGARTPVE